MLNNLPIDPKTGQSLDQGVVTLAKAIRSVESNNRYDAVGASGEHGAYQFMPSTYKSWAGQYLGDPNAPMTPQNQDMIAYYKIQDLKNQGFTPEQTSSIWNSGSPDSAGKVGTNSKGISYDTPKYVNSVISKYQQFRQGIEGGQTLPNPSEALPAGSADPSVEQPKSVGGFIGNIFGSAGNLIGGLANSVIHPIQTLQGLGQVIHHPVQDFLQPEAQRYGIDKLLQGNFGGALNQLGDTLYKDPVGVALDASTILGGVGALGKLGAEGGTLAQIGETAAKASEASNPLSLLGKGVGKVGGGLKSLAQGSLGLTTGEGATFQKIIEDATRQGGTKLDAVNAGMKMQPEDILANAKQGVSDLIQEKRDTYNTNLDTLGNETFTTKNGQLYVKREVTQADITAGNAAESSLGKTDTFIPTDLTTKGVKDVTTRTLKAFGVDAKGTTLDFTNTPLPKSYTNDLDEMVQRIYNWNDITPKGIDNLKQVVDSYYRKTLSPSSADNKFNAIITKVRDNVSNYAEKKVPQLAKLNADFAAQNKNILDLQKGLSLKNNIQPETAINKLLKSLNDDKSMRRELLKKLPGNLMENIAGYKSASLLPGGSIGKLADVGGGLGAIINPAAAIPIAGSLLTTSPKLVGLVAKATGLTERASDNLVQLLSRKTGLSPSQLALMLAQANRTTASTTSQANQ